MSQPWQESCTQESEYGLGMNHRVQAEEDNIEESDYMPSFRTSRGCSCGRCMSCLGMSNRDFF